MKLYKATIKFYDETMDTPELVTDHMIIAGKSMSAAADIITDYYGEDNIDTISLTLINYENPFVILSEGVCDAVVKDGVV